MTDNSKCFEVKVQHVTTQTYWVRALTSHQARNHALLTNGNRHQFDSQHVVSIEALDPQPGPERDRVIADMYRREHTSWSIAKMLGMSRSGVERALDRITGRRLQAS